MSPAALNVQRDAPGLAWRARDGDEVVGTVSALVRPDGRCYVFPGPCRADALGPLLAAVAEVAGPDLRASVDETDEAGLARYLDLGFEVERRESRYLIPTSPQVTGLDGAEMPAGLAAISAAAADEDRLRLLDDALRQDVPGTDGWAWDAAGFHAETFGPDFEPATYLVAADQATGEYAGLARVWNGPQPRLGLIAVLAPYRRRGLARALLAQAFGVLHRRGVSQVSAEVDDINVASRALLTGLGARRSGGTLELVKAGHRPSCQQRGPPPAGDGPMPVPRPQAADRQPAPRLGPGGR